MVSEEVVEFIKKHEMWKTESRDEYGERVGGRKVSSEVLLNILEEDEKKGWEISVTRGRIVSVKRIEMENMAGGVDVRYRTFVAIPIK